MIVAVLSGKGGTGKTLVSVNLSAAAKQSTYVDSDVEEPNGHLFLKPKNLKRQDVSTSIPIIDETLCDGCRACVDFCKFNALSYVGKVFLFEDICHSCGGCTYVCPTGAIDEKEKNIGYIECGNRDDITVITGVMNIGILSGVPIVKELNKIVDKTSGTTFIDCPPGSSCSVIESIKKADYCLIVTEPTLFGVHNMEMVHDLARLFGKPCGVVINKSTESISLAQKYCQKENIKILSKIPLEGEIAKTSSSGDILVYQNEKYFDIFAKLLRRIEEKVAYETVINP